MDINTLHAKASEYLENNDIDKAREIYEKILEVVPNDEAALTSLMDIYQDVDRFKYYMTRANYNIVSGKLEYGINDCKKALNVDAHNITAREKLARLYRVTNKPLKAIDEFSRVIEIDPSHIESYFELIDLYVKEKALDSAIEIAIRGKEKFSGQSNFEDVLAKLYFDSGDYENALGVVKDDSLKVKILLQDEKNEQAKEILEKMNTEGAQKEHRAMVYLLWAQYYYNVKNFDLAFEYIDKYTSITGPNALSFQMKALCYEEQGNEFMTAYNFGYMNKALNKPDEALVEFSSAFGLNPKNKDVLIELAKLYESNKEKYTAMEYWQKVYELDGDENAKSILADFYTKEGDTAMAEKFGATFKKDEPASYDMPIEEDEGLLNKLINIFSKK